MDYKEVVEKLKWERKISAQLEALMKDKSTEELQKLYLSLQSLCEAHGRPAKL